MKPDRLGKSIAIVFVVTLICYFAVYSGIERRRVRNGPWQVTFTNDLAGAPAVLVDQPRLGITNVQITFSAASRPALASTNLSFTEPRPVPYDVPYGKCIFMDTTFLPGTLVLELFGHEVQLLPRVLMIDRKEVAWRSGETIALPISGTTNEHK